VILYLQSGSRIFTWDDVLEGDQNKQKRGSLLRGHRGVTNPNPRFLGLPALPFPQFSRANPTQELITNDSKVYHFIKRHLTSPPNEPHKSQIWSRREQQTVATRMAVATSTQSAAATAPAAHLRTRQSRDSPSATWSSPLPSVRFFILAYSTLGLHISAWQDQRGGSLK